MTMTIYEKATVAMSLIALGMSSYTTYEDRIAPRFSKNLPQVFVENKIFVSSRLGYLNISPVITVANEGASEITLGHIEGEIRLQSGGIIKLQAENFYKNGSSFYLREVSIKPGQVWSEHANVAEEIPQNKEEEISTIEEKAFESIKEQRRPEQAMFIKAMIPLFEALQDDSKKKIDPKERRAKLDAAIKQIEEQGAPIFASPSVISEAKKVFDSNIARIEKGQHILKLALFDRSNKPIWEGNFDFVLYEKQVMQFQKSFDSFGKVESGNYYSWQPAVSITLRPKKPA